MKALQFTTEAALLCTSIALLAWPARAGLGLVLCWAPLWLYVTGTYFWRRFKQGVLNTSVSELPQTLHRQPRTGWLTGLSIMAGAAAFVQLCVSP